MAYLRGRAATLAGLTGILALLVLAAGCDGSESVAQPGPTAAVPAAAAAEAEPEEEALVVRAGTVRVEPMSELYATSATLRADKQATVTARTHGVVRRLLVEEGARVEEGQPLAELEDDEQKIEFSRTKTTLENQRREYERAKTLHAQNMLSEEAYETARREAEEAEHAASLAELNLSRTVIRAPFRGTVLVRHLDVGTTVNDGTPVYDVADLSPLFADVNVPETQISRLAPGQKVRIAAGTSDETATARIDRIAPSVDPSTGTVKVTLSVQRNARLRPGSFVRVQIVTDTHAEALVVPRSALVAEGRRWHIFRVKPEGDVVERVEVARGFEEGDRVEIVNGPSDRPPLGPGDRVVVVGASALSDEARIRIMDPAEASGEDDDARAADAEADRVAT